MSLQQEDEIGVDGQQAYLALQTVLGKVPADTAGVARISVPMALQSLLDAGEVADGTRLEVLGDLAKEDFPDYEAAEEQYRALAGKVAAAGDLSADQLLEDLKADARLDVAFAESRSGRQLPHVVTAFFGQDVCRRARVRVDNKEAVWLFGEFETDAPFAKVADWVDPHNWPARGEFMFKSMKPISGPVQQLPGAYAGQDAWHADFLEIVQLVQELRTELHCDYVRVDGLFAGSTYDLVKSRDEEIDVDRGFLLVNDLGQTRNVKCLKVVSFTDDEWDEVAYYTACFVWTQFIRLAVEGGTRTDPVTPTQPQGPFGLREVAAEWIRCVTDTGRTYLGRSADWMEQNRAGYDLDAAVRDTAGLWLSLTRDWINAGVETLRNLELMAVTSPDESPAEEIMAGWMGADVRAASRPRGRTAAADAAIEYTTQMLDEGFTASRPGYEGATLPWQGLRLGDRLTCSDLVRLGAQQDVVPASQISVTAVPLRGAVGAHLEMPVGTIRPGLYVGQLNRNGEYRPCQVYVSRATGSSSSGQ